MPKDIDLGRKTINWSLSGQLSGGGSKYFLVSTAGLSDSPNNHLPKWNRTEQNKTKIRQASHVILNTLAATYFKKWREREQNSCQ